MSRALVPQKAAVRPRVLVADCATPRLLEEEVAELLGRREPVVAYLVGPPGSGRTTALAHLAAVFAGDSRLGLRDTDGGAPGAEPVTVVAARICPEAGITLALAPWDEDDVLEYLLHAHRDHAAEVLAAWRGEPVDHGLGYWPGLCRAVLDTLAERRAGNVLAAMRLVITAQVPPALADSCRLIAVRHCARQHVTLRESPNSEVPLLAVPIVRAQLAADYLLQASELGWEMPRTLYWSPLLRAALRDEVERSGSEAVLVQRCALHKDEHAVALSVLCAVRPGFRPPVQALTGLECAYLAGADLADVEIRGSLWHADLSGADLRGAALREVQALGVRLDRAQLAGANLEGVAARQAHARGVQASGARMQRADFADADLRQAMLDRADLRQTHLDRAHLSGASLRDADLTAARLHGARLDGADLRGARCIPAWCTGLDLRAARLDGASFAGAHLAQANLAETVLADFVAEGASFHRALLTSARWPGALLRGADFTEAGIADVHWEGADLRECKFDRASFHLGSSRSGLVDSLVAGEGSRTGFYTDESLEDRFRAPEDVRKADLRGCDLRGARIADCDFYLVDLRRARLDPGQVEWLRRCRAILDR